MICSEQEYLQRLPQSRGTLLMPDAYGRFLKHNKLESKIKLLTKSARGASVQKQKQVAAKIRAFLRKGTLPPDLTASIEKMSETRTFRFIDIDRVFAPQKTIQDAFVSLYDTDAFLARESAGQDHISYLPPIMVQPQIGTKSSPRGVLFFEGQKDAVPITLTIKTTGGMAWTIFIDGLRRGKKAILQRTFSQRKKKAPLSDAEVIELAERAYAYALQTPNAYELELSWAKDPKRGEIVFDSVHTRRVAAARSPLRYIFKSDTEMLMAGISVSYGIAAGALRFLDTAADLSRIKQGDILCIRNTRLNSDALLQKAAAVVLIEESAPVVRQCQERSIPCIRLDKKDATETLKDGQRVTLYAADGGAALYDGMLPYEVHPWGAHLPKTKTSVSAELSDPMNAEHLQELPIDGVGLLRMADLLPRAHGNKEHLASEIARVAVYMYPRPVIIELLNTQKLSLQSAAITMVRMNWGLDNVHLRLQACQTPNEGELLLQKLKKDGLVRGENGLRIGLTYSIPNNSILADYFAELFDELAVSVEKILEEDVRPRIRTLGTLARSTGTPIHLTGVHADIQPTVVDLFLAQGISRITVRPHDVIPLKLRLADREKTQTRQAKQMSKAYMGIVVLFASFSATLLTLGSGCVPKLAAPEEARDAYAAPAQMRAQLEEKIEQEIRAAVQKEQAIERANAALPEFTLQYPNDWEVQNTYQGITFHAPQGSQYLRIYKQGANLGVPTAVSEKQSIVFNSKSAFRFSTATTTVIELILDSGQTLFIEGDTQNFDYLIRTLKFDI